MRSSHKREKPDRPREDKKRVKTPYSLKRWRPLHGSSLQKHWTERWITTGRRGRQWLEVLTQVSGNQNPASLCPGQRWNGDRPSNLRPPWCDPPVNSRTSPDHTLSTGGVVYAIVLQETDPADISKYAKKTLFGKADSWRDRNLAST